MRATNPAIPAHRPALTAIATRDPLAAFSRSDGTSAAELDDAALPSGHTSYRSQAGTARGSCGNVALRIIVSLEEPVAGFPSLFG
jgi:hypothetical protein